MEVTNRYKTTKTHIDGAPKESHFELKTEALALSVEPGSNFVIVKNLYVSIDPYQINRMKSQSSSQKSIGFAFGIAPSEVIDTYGVAKVVASGNPKFEKDDLVVGLITWGEYSVLKEGIILNKLDPMGFPLTYHVGILGFSGLAAYGGFFEVCKPKKGEKVFVSAASGSVGKMVGQYAKQLGCYVVGCAGTKQKNCLKRSLDLMMHSTTEKKQICSQHCKDGIDIYFDNVGGEMLEAAVDNVNTFGRIAVCGVIAEYTDAGKRAAPDMLNVVYKRIRIQGYLATDYLNMYADFISTTSDHLRTGNMQALEDITSGVENIPSAFIGLFRDDNIGKKIVKLVDE
ncbi:hypothetical protein ACB092_01G350900 [Castanea dentata]